MVPETSSPAVPARAVFRKPTRDDALILARQRFMAGERVEMQTLAAELDVSRTTVYRWVGEREQLMAEIFSGLIDEWLAVVAPHGKGAGFDWFIDVLRRFLVLAADSNPVTGFTARRGRSRPWRCGF